MLRFLAGLATFMVSLGVVVAGCAAESQTETASGVVGPTCPDGSSPTLDANVVGLVATAAAAGRPSSDDSRCLTHAIAVPVPAVLGVTRGGAGHGKATLSFRDSSTGRVHRCNYRGSGSAAYEFVNCTAALRVGQVRLVDFFQLHIDGGDASQGDTEVRVRFGSGPDDAGGTLVSPNAAIAGAQLVIPAGAVSAFEHISIDVLSGAEPVSPLPLGIHGYTAGGFGVQIVARERGDLSELPTAPDGTPMMLTLPYDAAALAQLGATEADLAILEVAAIRPWGVPIIRAVRRDFTVDTASHTLTLGVHNASGYISAVAGGARRIPFNGGPVMKGSAPIHLVYYGTLSATQRQIIEDLIGGLSGSNWLGILGSYNDSSASLPTTNVSLGQTWTFPMPQTTFTDNMTDTVIQDAIDNHHLPRDINAIYFVVLGNNVSSSCASHCGYHTSGLSGIKYGLIQNPGNVNGTPSGGGSCGCSIGSSPNGDAAADSMASIFAHEIAETLSDPEPNSGWSATVGSSDVENADNCAWQTGETYAVGTAHANSRVGVRDYLLQQNWVNIGNGWGYCAVRVETDDARFSAMGTTLPEPPRGESYHPMIPGKQYIALISYDNTGDTAWRDAGANGEQYLLGSQSPQDNDLFGVSGRVGTGGRVEPGTAHTFGFTFSAQQLFPGLDYIFQWKMVREAVRWFGQATPPVVVRMVFNGAAVSGSSASPTVSDDPVDVTATFRNTSGAAWRSIDGYSLRIDGGAFSSPSSLSFAFDESIEPGESKTFTFRATSPHVPGTYTMHLQMQQDGVGRFGEALDVAVEVRPSDRAAFESQTVPSLMSVWSGYEVHATFRNTGTSTWGPGYRLDTSGLFQIASVVPLTTMVAPGQSYEFVATVTPFDPGHYEGLPILGFFQLQLANPSGRDFASAASLAVTIRKPIETLATCEDFNVPSTMGTGQTYHVYNVMRNRGETTWTTAFGLASTPPGDTKWGINFVPLAHPVDPNEAYRFEYDIVAPAVGQYTYGFMMATDSSAQHYFFDACVRDVTVVATANDSATYLPEDPDVSKFCTKKPMISCYVQQLLCIGHHYNPPMPITMTNSGGSTWTKASGFALSVEDPRWGVTRIELGDGEAIAPGQTKTFEFAPAAPNFTGFLDLRFRMTHDGVGAFGDETPAGIQQFVGSCGG